METVEDILKDKTVLLVDDDTRNIFALVSYLESIDIRVVTAENGIEALNILSAENEIRIVLLDMMMPEMDGYETLEEMSNKGLLGKIPVIAVTAKAMIGDREKCLEAGATDYVSKPVNLAELTEKMSRLIQN